MLSFNVRMNAASTRTVQPPGRCFAPNLHNSKSKNGKTSKRQSYKSKARVGFGSQIRNYFLHPDQRVKDARTGYSMGNFHSVLDGNIEGFLDAYLQWRAKQNA